LLSFYQQMFLGHGSIIRSDRVIVGHWRKKVKNHWSEGDLRPTSKFALSAPDEKFSVRSAFFAACLKWCSDADRIHSIRTIVLHFMYSSLESKSLVNQRKPKTLKADVDFSKVNLSETMASLVTAFDNYCSVSFNSATAACMQAWRHWHTKLQWTHWFDVCFIRVGTLVLLCYMLNVCN